MTRTIADKLEPLANALRALPEEAQDAVLAEAQGHIKELNGSVLNDAQRAEVKRRLALPRVAISHEDVRAILRRYNPAL